MDAVGSDARVLLAVATHSCREGDCTSREDERAAADPEAEERAAVDTGSGERAAAVPPPLPPPVVEPTETVLAPPAEVAETAEML